MPLNRQAAKVRLLQLMEDMASRRDNPLQARQDYADQFIDLMAELMTTATITGTVTTAGTAAAQTGTITSATLS